MGRKEERTGKPIFSFFCLSGENAIKATFQVVYAAPSSLEGDFERSIAGRDFVNGGEDGFDGGEVAMLSRSSRLARALDPQIRD